MLFSLPLSVLLSATIPSALAAPATSPSKTLEARTVSQCGQYSSISTGAFTLYSNEWGASTSGTTGSQCSYITGLQNGNSLQWVRGEVFVQTRSFRQQIPRVLGK